MSGACTPAEYASGVAAAHGVVTAFPDVEPDQHVRSHQELERDATAVLNYIRAYRSGTIAGRLAKLLAEGSESAKVEFKSSLRFNLREQRVDRRMTDVVTKTIAGFLNTEGGTLLIGVNDDAQVVGIDMDDFESNDKFLRHLHTSATNALGVAAAASIRATVQTTPRGSVCIVDCPPSPSRVLCSHKGKPPILYIRTGPQTIPVEGVERERYERHRWQS